MIGIGNPKEIITGCLALRVERPTIHPGGYQILISDYAIKNEVAEVITDQVVCLRALLYPIFSRSHLQHVHIKDQIPDGSIDNIGICFHMFIKE